MRKKLKRVEERITKVVSKVRLPEILSFSEKPSVNSPGQQPDPSSQPSLGASDLFTLFTADIIKKDVVFTR